MPRITPFGPQKERVFEEGMRGMHRVISSRAATSGTPEEEADNDSRRSLLVTCGFFDKLYPERPYSDR
jgi:hypothetical protein